MTNASDSSSVSSSLLKWARQTARSRNAWLVVIPVFLVLGIYSLQMGYQEKSLEWAWFSGATFAFAAAAAGRFRLLGKLGQLARFAEGISTPSVGQNG
jgi:hypothetical protein